MPGFRLEAQGDGTDAELTFVYKEGTPLSVARTDLTKIYIKAMEALIIRLEDPKKVEEALASKPAIEGDLYGG